jgi:1,4-dihydroxy-2-naphthoate polyprenyltransferase
MPPSRARLWIHAARPKTLPAGAIPVLVGSAFAYRDDAFDPWPAAAALAGALLIQIGTNYANDYHDHVRGADSPDRRGPLRASASGLLPPRRVLGAAFASFALAVAVGAYLIAVAGWPILVIGLLSLASGWAYTGGPYPLGYHGWGELFVLAFFGFVAVGGTYYVQSLHWPGVDAWAAAAGVGALAAAILVVNNLRDRETDARAGKRTLAVRLGDRGTRLEYVLLLTAAYAVTAGLYLLLEKPLLLLPLASLPLAAWLISRLWREHDPRRLNPLLPRTAQLLTLYGLLLAAGVAF